MEYITSQAFDIIDKSGHLLINVLSDTCPACEAFKATLPTDIIAANERGIKVYNIAPIDENKQFFERYPCETLPYTFVFSNGEFVGGDSFDTHSFKALIEALDSIHVECSQ